MTPVSPVPVRAPVLSRLRWRVPSSNMIVWVWLLVLALIRAGSPEERDPYWEAKAGIENLTGTPLVRPDSWSWAPVDGVFYPNSPGWNMLLGVAWKTAGFWGLFVFTTLTLLACFGLMYLLARRLGAHPLPAFAAVLIGFLLSYRMLSARATIGVQDLVLLAMFVPLWWSPQLNRRRPWTTAVVLFVTGLVLSTAGNWVHLSFVAMSAAIAVAWAVFWLVSDWPGWSARLRDGRRWAAALAGGAGMGVGVFTTPYGLAGVLARSAATKAACEGVILEWVSPFLPGLETQWPVTGVATLLLLAALVWWFVRRVRAGRADGRVALVAAISVVAVPFAVAGLSALRFLAVAVMLFVPVLGMWVSAAGWAAQRWARALPVSSVLAEPAVRWTQSHGWRIVLSLTVVLISPLVVVLGPVAHAVPAEMEAIRSLPSGCRLFTTASIAGPVILTRPDVPVWYDGRADYFGAERLAAATQFFYGTSSSAAPVGATCVILPGVSAKEPLPRATTRLDADPQWRRAGSFNSFDVWLRA